MSQIIIPGDTRDEFAYGKLIGGESKIPTAMFKFPKTMMDRIGTSDEEMTRMILLANPKDDADGEFEVTCYEFFSVSFPTGSVEKPDDVLELDKDKLHAFIEQEWKEKWATRDGRPEEFAEWFYGGAHDDDGIRDMTILYRNAYVDGAVDMLSMLLDFDDGMRGAEAMVAVINAQSVDLGEES